MQSGHLPITLPLEATAHASFLIRTPYVSIMRKRQMKTPVFNLQCRTGIIYSYTAIDMSHLGLTMQNVSKPHPGVGLNTETSSLSKIIGDIVSPSSKTTPLRSLLRMPLEIVAVPRTRRNPRNPLPPIGVSSGSPLIAQSSPSHMET